MIGGKYYVTYVIARRDGTESRVTMVHKARSIISLVPYIENQISEMYRLSDDINMVRAVKIEEVTK